MSSTWQVTKTESIEKILCYYTNSSHRIQRIRIHNGTSRDLNLEKIVFPQQRILFEALSQGQVEIYLSQADKPSCINIIPCLDLKVNQVSQKPTLIENIALYQDKSA